MVFDTLKKHQDQKEVEEHLKAFRESFSEEQKKAVICGLFLVANIDGQYHEDERKFFEETADVLDYQLKDNLDQQVREFLGLGREELFKQLNGLNDEQKDWFVATVLSMIHADGEALDKEIQYADEIFEKMGVTHERCEKVINNSPALQAIKES